MSDLSRGFLKTTRGKPLSLFGTSFWQTNVPFSLTVRITSIFRCIPDRTDANVRSFHYIHYCSVYEIPWNGDIFRIVIGRQPSDSTLYSYACTYGQISLSPFLSSAYLSPLSHSLSSLLPRQLPLLVHLV